MKISKALDKKIRAYIERHQPEIYWDRNEYMDRTQIKKIIEEGLDEFENEIWDMNVDYIVDTEEYYIKNDLYDMFKDELTAEFLKEYDAHELKDVIVDYLRDNYRDYICIDLQIDELLKRAGDITCLVYMYSNYDCTNSFDTMKSSEYLQSVYNRAKYGVRKDDFIWEHQNGAYGGALFAFAFNTSIQDYLELKEQSKTSKKIYIPKGTQFGFFSSMHGASSLFDKTTHRAMWLNRHEEGIDKATGDEFTKYDAACLEADIMQNYNLEQVFGDTDFINKQSLMLA